MSRGGWRGYLVNAQAATDYGEDGRRAVRVTFTMAASMEQSGKPGASSIAAVRSSTSKNDPKSSTSTQSAEIIAQSVNSRVRVLFRALIGKSRRGNLRKPEPHQYRNRSSLRVWW